MKLPKKILKPNTYPISGDKVEYTEYKFSKKVYDGCYEYIYFWKNYEGKWKCFKIYLEKGNRLYSQY